MQTKFKFPNVYIAYFLLTYRRRGINLLFQKTAKFSFSCICFEVSLATEDFLFRKHRTSFSLDTVLDKPVTSNLRSYFLLLPALTVSTNLWKYWRSASYQSEKAKGRSRVMNTTSCVAGCSDAETEPRLSFVNLHRWPEAEAQFLKSLNHEPMNDNNKRPSSSLQEPYASRQRYIRSLPLLLRRTVSSKNKEEDEESWSPIFFLSQ